MQPHKVIYISTDLQEFKTINIEDFSKLKTGNKLAVLKRIQFILFHYNVCFVFCFFSFPNDIPTRLYLYINRSYIYIC